jgi:DNA-3-methyladenine glycosylase II
MAKVKADDPWHRARLHLRRRDAVLKPIITRVGPCTMRPLTDLFAALVRSIVAQQISTKAARSISQKLIDGPCRGVLSAKAILSATDDELRAAGLSTAKRLSLRDLSAHVEDGRVELHRMAELSDDEVIGELVPVRGIGRWTAQMFLMFSLGRPNVLPVDDLGLKTAVKRCYGLAQLPTRAEIEDRAAPWHPFCSVATWYLWRSLDGAAAL